jgi:hypothetical protein
VLILNSFWKSIKRVGQNETYVSPIINTMEKITSFKQMKVIIEPIPADQFCRYCYFDGERSCFLGHIHRHINPKDESAWGDKNGYGARQLTEQMLKEVHDIHDRDGSMVNNHPTVNGYTEPVIKDRVMHMIEDGIEWEESKTIDDLEVGMTDSETGIV